MSAPTARVQELDRVDGAVDAIGDAVCAVVKQVFSERECAAWTAGVHAAERAWTRDFGGEQFSLGNAFYTHFEEGKSARYFASAAASDALVEASAPGLQAALRDLVSRVTRGRAIPRRGWGGPGVHIFPPNGPVARRGGVIHFDTEGLAAQHVAQRRPALTAVLMLAPPEDGGGLTLWDVTYEGRDAASEAELARPHATVRSGPGDVVVFQSYQLHQIEPFTGERPRISATVHAAATDRDLWETWF